MSGDWLSGKVCSHINWKDLILDPSDQLGVALGHNFIIWLPLSHPCCYWPRDSLHVLSVVNQLLRKIQFNKLTWNTGDRQLFSFCNILLPPFVRLISEGLLLKLCFLFPETGEYLNCYMLHGIWCSFICFLTKVIMYELVWWFEKDIQSVIKAGKLENTWH